MILCFSGTGNSRYIADMLSEKIGDDVVSINDLLKEDNPYNLVSEFPYVIVCPIYAWRIAGVAYDFLKKVVFRGNKLCYFVPTMGLNSGIADRYCKELCEESGLIYKGFQGIVMPDNYMAGFDIATMDKAMEKINAVTPVVDAIAAQIRAEADIEKTDVTEHPWLKSAIINPLFNKFVCSSKKFYVSDDCNSCGKCLDYCPVSNIKMQNGHPEFGKSCVNCYACIHRCPKKAINIKGKTENKGRYICPTYKNENQ